MKKSLYDKTNVVSVTDDDFIISKEPRIRSSLWRPGDQGYLMAQVSWCPHCQSKVPMWTKLANEINTNPETDFIIMATDIENESPLLASGAGITGIPTLFYVLSDGGLKKISSRQPGTQAPQPSDMTTDWSEEDLRSRISTASKKKSGPTKSTKALGVARPIPRGRNQKGGRLF